MTDRLTERYKFDKRLRFAYFVVICISVVTLGITIAAVLVARFSDGWDGSLSMVGAGLGILAIAKIAVGMGFNGRREH